MTPGVTLLDTHSDIKDSSFLIIMSGCFWLSSSRIEITK